MAFYGRLKELRKSKNLTQKYMAEYLGLTVRNYQRYEADEIDPPTSKTQMLADFFNVSVDYLLGRTDFLHNPDENIKPKTTPNISATKDSNVNNNK